MKLPVYLIGRASKALDAKGTVDTGILELKVMAGEKPREAKLRDGNSFSSLLKSNLVASPLRSSAPPLLTTFVAAATVVTLVTAVGYVDNVRPL